MGVVLARGATLIRDERIGFKDGEGGEKGEGVESGNDGMVGKFCVAMEEQARWSCDS